MPLELPPLVWGSILRILKKLRLYHPPLYWLCITYKHQPSIYIERRISNSNHEEIALSVNIQTSFWAHITLTRKWFSRPQNSVELPSQIRSFRSRLTLFILSAVINTMRVILVLGSIWRINHIHADAVDEYWGIMAYDTTTYVTT
jgi:transcriptional antiterminator